MLIAIVDFEFEPETRDTALSVLVEQADAARAMPGNLAYRPFAEPDSATKVSILQEWRDSTAFEAYAASPVFAHLGASLRPIMTSPPHSRRLSAELMQVQAE